MATSSTSGLSTFNGITGLATGLDTESIVKQLLSVDRIPLDKLSQKKQILEWQQSDYRNINVQMLSFRNIASSMRLQSTYKQYSATSSNSNVISASASTSATQTSYSFSSVTSLANTGNIMTADGASISRQTSVLTGSAITDSIDTNVNNTFKISLDGGAFVDITLDPGKVYNGSTPGGTYKDLANDIQTKIDAAIGAGNVKVTLDSSNQITFSSNNYPAGGAPKTIILQEGAAADLLSSSLKFTTNDLNQVTSMTEKINIDDTIYNNLLQHRFGNTEDFGWVVNGSYANTLGLAADNVISTVDFNSTNVANYHVSTVETDTVTVAGAPSAEVTSNLAYNSSNLANTKVYVNGTEYEGVYNTTLDKLEDGQVLLSNDGTGKLELTFKNQLQVGDSVRIDTKTDYTVVTDKLQAELSANEVLVENDGTGKAKFTFKNTLAAGSQVSVDRHDFEFSTTVYDQDGVAKSETFTIDGFEKSMSDVIGLINNSTDAHLTAFYDEASDKMVMTSKYTGNNNIAGSEVSVSGSFLTSAMQLTKSTEGTDAAFAINGLSTTRKSNTFEINGVTFTLSGTTTNTTTVTVSQDVNKVYDSIKSFVDAYNELIANINTKTSEERDRDYVPLTSAQKAEMETSDIELWETKAKKGLLYRDSLLSKITSSMRSALYATVQGATDSKFDQLSEIGITTSKVYTDNGKLVIDESKLRGAIANNPDKVMELFTKSSTSTDSTTQYNENGLGTRIYNLVNDSIDDLTSKAGQTGNSIYSTSTIGDQLKEMALRIEDLEYLLDDKQDKYYKMYASLETYMNRMNAQSSWIASQFGG